MKVLTVLLQITALTSITMVMKWHSPNQHRNTSVAVGEVAPDFTLQDQNGNKMSLSDARGKSPIVLVFYRGYW